MVVAVEYISKEESAGAETAKHGVTGILAVQGAFAEHAAMLDKLGAQWKRLENDDNVYFGALDATVRRNAYGRQLGSFASTADFGDIKDFPLVFIRGPFVSDVGADATIETEVDGRVVGLRQGNILATAFHPELTDDTRIHELFLSL